MMIEISKFEALTLLGESLVQCSARVLYAESCFDDTRHKKIIRNVDKAIDYALEIVNAYLRDYRSSIKLADEAWERETAALKAQNAEAVKEAKRQKHAAAQKSKKEGKQ